MNCGSYCARNGVAIAISHPINSIWTATTITMLNAQEVFLHGVLIS